MLSTKFLLILSACLCAWQDVSAQRLVVRVHDEQGDPLMHAKVSLRDARDRAVKPTRKKDGVFTFQEIPDGYDALQVKASGKALYGCQWFGSLPDAVRMTMRSGPYHLIDEGHRHPKLVFDERHLEVDGRRCRWIGYMTGGTTCTDAGGTRHCTAPGTIGDNESVPWWRTELGTAGSPQRAVAYTVSAMDNEEHRHLRALGHHRRAEHPRGS